MKYSLQQIVDEMKRQRKTSQTYIAYIDSNIPYGASVLKPYDLRACAIGEAVVQLAFLAAKDGSIDACFKSTSVDFVASEIKEILAACVDLGRDDVYPQDFWNDVDDLHADGVCKEYGCEIEPPIHKYVPTIPVWVDETIEDTRLDCIYHAARHYNLPLV